MDKRKFFFFFWQLRNMDDGAGLNEFNVCVGVWGWDTSPYFRNYFSHVEPVIIFIFNRCSRAFLFLRKSKFGSISCRFRRHNVFFNDWAARKAGPEVMLDTRLRRTVHKTHGPFPWKRRAKSVKWRKSWRFINKKKKPKMFIGNHVIYGYAKVWV